MSVLWDTEALWSKVAGNSFNIHFSKLKEQNRDRKLIEMEATTFERNVGSQPSCALEKQIPVISWISSNAYFCSKYTFT